MIETYITIDEFPNYAISNLGNCKRIRTNRVVTPQLKWGSYLTVAIFKDGKRVTRSLHQLVAKAFIPNPENKPCVNHRFGNKMDNRSSELEWVTYSENNQHAYDTCLKLYRPLHYKGKFGKDHNRSKRVYQYDEDANLIMEFGSVSEAHRKTGVCLPDISKSARRNTYQAGGFVWSYIPLYKETFPKKPKPNCRKVAMMTHHGEIVKIFDSFTDAAEFVGCKKSCISQAVAGWVRQIKGHKWTYV